MSDTIVAEQFSLTPAIRAHIEKNIARIRDRLPRGSSVAVCVGEPTRKVFTALFKVHAWGRDIVARDFAPDLYAAVTQARTIALRRMSAVRPLRRESSRSVPSGA